MRKRLQKMRRTKNAKFGKLLKMPGMQNKEKLQNS